MDEEVRAFKRKARALGGKISMGLDEIEIRQMMPLSLSYDHRIVDGGDAARFLNEVIGYLQAPSRLLLAP